MTLILSNSILGNRKITVSGGGNSGVSVATSNHWLFNGTPGAVSISPFSFSCSSTRTAQTSPTTIVTGIAANQGYCNMWGFQHERVSQNLITYNSNMGPNYNTNLFGYGTGVITYGIASPYGNGAKWNCSVGYSGVYDGYGLTTPTFSPVTSQNKQYSLSCWTKNTGDALSRLHIWAGAYTGGVETKAQTLDEIDGSSAWHRIETYSIQTQNMSSGLYIGDNNFATNSVLNLAQFEPGPTTSLIPTSTSATTRNRTNISFTVPNVNLLNFRIDMIAKFSSAQLMTNYTGVGGTQAYGILEDNNGRLFDVYMIAGGSRGKLRHKLSGTQVFGQNILSWNDGDLLSFQGIINGTTRITTIYTYINGVLTYTDTLTWASTFTMASLCYFGASQSVDTFSNKGITYIGYQ